MKPTSMTVYRNGTFEVAAPEVEGKCGVFGKRAFRFEAWFTATSNDLDERGFIVDNADLFRYFRDTYAEGSPFTSCERMCLKALVDWQGLWPYATKITARVWGLEDVTYVEATWERPRADVELENASLRMQVEDLREQLQDAEYEALERAGSCELALERTEVRLGMDYDRA